jgi:hypothetical protein
LCKKNIKIGGMMQQVTSFLPKSAEMACIAGDDDVCIAETLVKGELVAKVSSPSSHSIDKWVDNLSEITGAKMTWCYRPCKGKENVAFIFFLGNKQAKEILFNTIREKKQSIINVLMLVKKGGEIPIEQ